MLHTILQAVNFLWILPYYLQNVLEEVKYVIIWKVIRISRSFEKSWWININITLIFLEGECFGIFFPVLRHQSRKRWFVIMYFTFCVVHVGLSYYKYGKRKGLWCDWIINVSLLNPFCATGLILYPLKTLESHMFSDVFRGKETSTMKSVNTTLTFWSF